MTKPCCCNCGRIGCPALRLKRFGKRLYCQRCTPRRHVEERKRRRTEQALFAAREAVFGREK